MYTASRGMHPACFPLSLALPVSMGTWGQGGAGGGSNSLQGVTTGSWVQGHFCDCSGVGRGQTIKKKLVGYLTNSSSKPKVSQMPCGSGAQRNPVILGALSVLHCNRLEFGKDRVGKAASAKCKAWPQLLRSLQSNRKKDIKNRKLLTHSTRETINKC